MHREQVEGFWGFYSHLLRPKQIFIHSECHMFRKGVKPMWEDPYNARGGKWSIRIKKQYSSHLWENLVRRVSLLFSSTTKNCNLNLLVC